MNAKLLKRLRLRGRNQITINSITRTNGTITGMSIGLNEDAYRGLFDFGDTEESQKYLLEKEEYNQLKKCLTLAFQRGYKTPGKAIRRILDIYQQNESKE